MKTKTQFFLLMTALFIISMSSNVKAQGRGHHKGHPRNHEGNDEKKHNNNYRQHDEDDHDDDDDDDHHDRHYSANRRPQGHHVYNHRHDRYCHHAPVVVHHYPSRPRYIYYRDYDVYYDYHRQVYISYSGRNWGVSASLPFAMHHVDRRRAVRMEVDYDHDDFPGYLESRRPAYRRVYRGD